MSQATSDNGLICFTNCLLPQEDGSFLAKDLWVDQQRGTILDAQVSFSLFSVFIFTWLILLAAHLLPSQTAS